MFTKVLLTVAVVAIIWFGFQFLQRVTDDRRRRGESGRVRTSPRDRAQAKPVEAGVQDLVKCPACGTWAAGREHSSCGRQDCPY